MTYDGLAHVSLLSYPEVRDRVILLDGWSKTYAMTGWRMGYSVWPEPLYDNIRKLAVNAWSCVNAPAQYAGIAALTGPQDSIGAMVAEFDRRRKLIVEERTGCRASRASRRRAPSTRSRTFRAPATRRRRSPRRYSKKPASPPSAGRTSACSAKGICVCRTPTPPTTSRGRSRASETFSVATPDASGTPCK